MPKKKKKSKNNKNKKNKTKQIKELSERDLCHRKIFQEIYWLEVDVYIYIYAIVF